MVFHVQNKHITHFVLHKSKSLLSHTSKSLFNNNNNKNDSFHIFFNFSTITSLSPSPTKNLTFSKIYQECAFYSALNPGRQAHARMIVFGFRPTVFVSNCLINVYVKSSHLLHARRVLDAMPQRDVVSYNSMIFGYTGCGEMESARWVFDEMPDRDVVSWNSMVSGFVSNGEWREAVGFFVEMGRLGVGIDATSFGVVLKACAGLEDSCLGIQVHGTVFRRGWDGDIVAGSALVDMYAKCGRLDDSLLVFREMGEKNWVSWSAMIAGCVQNDMFVDGLELFKEMQKDGLGVSQSIYASLFRSCAALVEPNVGMQLHGHALKSSFASDVIVGTATLDMYAKCGNIADAQKQFYLMPKCSLQSHNAIIIGHARGDHGFEALQFFHLLLRSGLGFDEISLSGVFSACASMKGKLEGLQLHGVAIKSTLTSSICVANAILDMYGKCGDLKEALCVFDYMEHTDSVSWNAIIAAHEQNEDDEGTLSFFLSMLSSRMEPDEFTYGSVLKACAGKEALDNGMEVHSRIVKSGMALETFVSGALVDMYCKCGMMEDAVKIHERTEQPSIVSWNAIISGFAIAKQSEDAQNFFSWMLDIGLKCDNFTYAAVLDTCGNLATVGLGKQIHAHVIKQDIQSDVYICSTLVDMYSKCGNMQDSRLMFDKAPNKDYVTWNAMLCGYAHHGHGEEALNIFEKMQLRNLEPNHATFVSVLRACAHLGLVEKGLHCFNVMQSQYELNPQDEHYSCMVDILGRAGHLEEALKLIEGMPFEADAVIWRTLLSTCKIQGNVEIAEKATSSILKIDPQDSSSYILLSNIYAEAGMWNKVMEIRAILRHGKLRKDPGCSWIEVKDEVHPFLVADKTHLRRKDIYKLLGVLIGEMKPTLYLPTTDLTLDENAEEYEAAAEAFEVSM